MSLRCFSVLAAVAQPAVGIQSNFFSEEESAAGLAVSVQMRQYALMHSEEGLTDRLFDHPKPSNLVVGQSARRLGESASLNEDGYNAVASLRSAEAMEAFAERLLKEDGLKVQDAKMLRKVMPFYNGECAKQSMKALRNELHEATVAHGCPAPWVTKSSSMSKKINLLEQKPSKNVKPLHGDVAPLNQDGYLAVVALKSDAEMKKFIRRISKAEGLSVMNEGGLSGFAKYYSGVCAKQSYKALVKELKSVQPVVKSTSISYELQPDEDLDDLKKRIAAATGLDVDQIDVGSGDDGATPDETNMKKALAAKLSIDEERVRVMKPDTAQQSAKATPAAPAVAAGAAKEAQAPAKPAVAAKKTTKTVVVTVTSADGVSVEDALKKVARESSKGMNVNHEPVTMRASIPKPESCGGGWVAPH
eukprot:TRINITY_DN217_c0_g1_i10.p1 TRINITY_DN217_c0_g1~~TRINITY_DN217_c0_g1_i10.p1  ORF type:complete len:418 (-),score=130.00 TRINITY_DN217_c0_g1_i10:167-1420(-)